VDGLTLILEDAVAHEPFSDDTGRIQPTLSDSAPRRGGRFVTWFLRQFLIAAFLFGSSAEPVGGFGRRQVAERVVQGDF
jgi:hypothetical protein